MTQAEEEIEIEIQMFKKSLIAMVREGRPAYWLAETLPVREGEEGTDLYGNGAESEAESTHIHRGCPAARGCCEHRARLLQSTLHL